MQFCHGDYVTHPVLGVGRFVANSSIPNISLVFFPAAGDRYNFDLPDDGQDTDYQLQGVCVYDLMTAVEVP